MEFLGKRFEKIKELAMKEGFGKFKGLAYITEEVGELAQDLIDGNETHARLEALDIFLSSLAVFYSLEGTDEEMEYRLKRACKKWERKLNG